MVPDELIGLAALTALEKAQDLYGRRHRLVDRWPEGDAPSRGRLRINPNCAPDAVARVVAGVRVSMDGRGRWMDNVFIERLWRSLKYECVFLNAFETGGEARAGIGRWIDFYNTRRPHSALAGRTPAEAYATKSELEKLAA